MSDSPKRAGAPEYVFRFEGQDFDFSAGTVADIEEMFSESAPVFILANQYTKAVRLVLESLVRDGWKIYPPSKP